MGKYEKGRESRERFLTAAAELLQERGYYGTGLNEILARSGSPRGSLYHHFPGGKDELTIAALQAAGAELGERLAGVFADAPDFATGLRGVFDVFRRELIDSDYRKGCPVAAVAQEVGGEHPEILAACGAIYADWEAGLADALSAAGNGGGETNEAGDSAGHRASSRPTTRQAAQLILCTLEGALLMTKTRRDPLYLDLAEAQILAANGG